MGSTQTSCMCLIQEFYIMSLSLYHESFFISSLQVYITLAAKTAIAVDLISGLLNSRACVLSYRGEKPYFHLTDYSLVEKMHQAMHQNWAEVLWDSDSTYKPCCSVFHFINQTLVWQWPWVQVNTMNPSLYHTIRFWKTSIFTMEGIQFHSLYTMSISLYHESKSKTWIQAYTTL